MKTVPEDVHDDRRDPTARALREQAQTARIRPSSVLRDRTLEALRSQPAALPLHRSPRRDWRLLLAAAAMIALAVSVSWILNSRENQPATDRPTTGQLAKGPADSPSIRPAPSESNRLPSITLTTNASVRLASFTRPLEREAEALQSDLKNLSKRVRSALPSPSKVRSAPQSRPAASPS